MKKLVGNELDINAAIGLNYIDLIEISDYFSKLYIQHKEEKVDVDYFTKKLYKFHESNNSVNSDEFICDLTTIRMLGLINDSSFELSKEFLANIHYEIFKDIYDYAGVFRDRNNVSFEHILNQDFLSFLNHSMINDSLDYDMLTIKNKKLYLMNISQKLNTLVKFNSNIWQVHPFLNGNTRTSAIFMIKLLKSLGINFDSMAFSDNARYYRNALVRSNYFNKEKGISSTDEYLILFYENLLLSKNNELKSSELILK